MKSKMLRGCVVIGIVLVLAVSGAAQANEWEGNVNFLLGWKWLDSEDWGTYDSQDEFAAMISFGKKDWPVQVAIDYIHTWDEGTWWDYLPEASTLELAIGVRKVWQHEKVRPFLGGGIALIHGEMDMFFGEDWWSRDDWGTGLWVDGGVFWRLGKSFNIGFEARYSTADATINEASRDPGGMHLGMILGFGW